MVDVRKEPGLVHLFFSVLRPWSYHIRTVLNIGVLQLSSSYTELTQQGVRTLLLCARVIQWSITSVTSTGAFRLSHIDILLHIRPHSPDNNGCALPVLPRQAVAAHTQRKNIMQKVRNICRRTSSVYMRVLYLLTERSIAGKTQSAPETVSVTHTHGNQYLCHGCPKEAFLEAITDFQQSACTHGEASSCSRLK